MKELHRGVNRYSQSVIFAQNKIIVVYFRVCFFCGGVCVFDSVFAVLVFFCVLLFSVLMFLFVFWCFSFSVCWLFSVCGRKEWNQILENTMVLSNGPFYCQCVCNILHN